MTQKCIKSGQKGPKNGQKHKKLFFSAPERARTVLNAFLGCMYFEFGLDRWTDGRLFFDFWVLFDHFYGKNRNFRVISGN